MAKGTYAEEFANVNGIKHTTREFIYKAIASGECGENVTWEFYENGELRICGHGQMMNYTSYKQQPWSNYRHLIKKIVIGADVTSIGNFAFAYSQNVESIEFEAGSKLERIGMLAFINLPKVNEVTLPDTVTYLGAYAFGDCYELENVYIPQGMEYIYFSAFYGSDKIVLNVASGSYAEKFANEHGITYTAR